MPANSQCVVLCLALGPIEHRTDESLRELERRGYKVWRSKGFSAIDQGRNVLAADALHQGYHETLWIDPDVAFEPDAVERLRSHKLPIVAGIYPQKGRRSLSCHVLPGTETITFGEDGGLIEIEYAAAGFLLVRRGAYETIRERLALPPCNARFGRPFWPFFQPLVKQAAVVRSATHSHPSRRTATPVRAIRRLNSPQQAQRAPATHDDQEQDDDGCDGRQHDEDLGLGCSLR